MVPRQNKSCRRLGYQSGSSSIIVGIDDTGVDWDHPDLNANVWINPGEIENNGIDDDNNGYIDDFRGWDFGGSNGTPDNNPMEDQPDHGTHVAGCASAVTNNGIGVAGIGFNTKVMAVKTSRNDQRDPSSGSPYIVYGYEGLLYSAQNGAKVINCSWGGSGFSMLGQTIVDEVTTLGSVVVAAAGNESLRDPFYPAAYTHVLAVASTTSNDTRSGFSNFGNYVDVAAPGSSIYNTWQNNTYASLSGTSMASPITAGLVALTMAQFPNLTSIQAAEKVRVACDNIDNLNPSYVGLLGKGRINALKSLQNTDFKSVRATEIVFSDAVTGNNDGIFQPGETITVFFRGKNHLNATSNLSATLVSKTAHATVGANPTATIGAVQSGSQFDNTNSLFQFTISNTAPEKLILHLTSTLLMMVIPIFSGLARLEIQLMQQPWETRLQLL
ncbi:MAG: S8 family serine peptidase [Ignavibacteriales bacterium]|nr:S8 family serine peptidase [Ignavibacteriales bacterium]